MGLYWEVYGLRHGDTISVSLTMVKEKAGAPRRARPGGEERPAVRLGWTESPQSENGPMSQTVALDLTKQSPGWYTLLIQVTSQGRGVATTHREIRISRN